MLGDRVQLQQVLLNLVKNAIEAVDASGSTSRVVTIATRAEHGVASVSVQDTGPGIGAGTREAIFNPFHSTKSAGMGMGLSISRTIVEAHGGTLTLDPDRKPGACFVFTVPFVAAAAAAPSS